MASVLEQNHPVWTSDLRPGCNEVWDFIHQTKDEEWMKSIDMIVTNPPFGFKREFYNQCLFYYKQYNIPFALLIPAEYNGWIIDAVRNDMCQKLVPTRRIDYLTPNMLQRINAGEKTQYQSLEEVPKNTLPRYSSSDFHSMWLLKGFNITIPNPVLPAEIYVELSLSRKKEDIL